MGDKRGIEIKWDFMGMGWTKLIKKKMDGRGRGKLQGFVEGLKSDFRWDRNASIRMAAIENRVFVA